MTAFDLNNRYFCPVHNTVSGTVSDDTVFHFQQSGTTISAEYKGGDVVSGHIIGSFTKPDTATLVYHCMTQDGELKAGEARAHFSINAANRLCIDMQWQWLNGTQASGTSHYEEISR